MQHAGYGNGAPQPPMVASTEHTVNSAFGFHVNTVESTVADICIESHFITPLPGTPNLLVASNNILRVYRLANVNDESRSECLEVLATFNFHGAIQSMEAVRLNNATLDSLFLTFLDAKLSVVEYDPSIHDLKTVSMHAFEDDDTRDGMVQRMGFPEVKVDPDGRCAAMLVYSTKFVILPFGKSSNSSADDSKVDMSSKFRSYLIDCQNLDPPIRNILDFVLLEGFYEPTLVVLYEPIPTSVGRYAMTRDTKAIATLSLNVSEQKNSIIWVVGDLPSDAQRLIGVPQPLGGVIVMGVNCLAYLNQATPPHGVSLNAYANNHTSFPLRIQEDAKMALDCAHHVMLTNTSIILSLKGGELYLLTLITDGRAFERFKFDKLAKSVLTQCICKLGSKYLFLGSRLGNSMLLKFWEVSQESSEEASTSEPSQKRMKLHASTNAVDDMFGETALYDDDDELSDARTTFKFEKVDSLLNTGPISNLVPTCIEGMQAEDPLSYELIGSCGYGRNGSLAIFQKSIRPFMIMTSEELSINDKCVDLWTVGGQTVSTDTKLAAYLVISKLYSTTILRITNGDLDEASASSGLIADSPTVYVGNLGAKKFIVQVCPQGVQLVHNDKQVQHIPAVGADIVSGDACDPYLGVKDRNGRFMLLKLNNSSNELDVVHVIEPDEDLVLAFSLYHDASGMFSTDDKGLEQSNLNETQSQASAEPSDIDKTKLNLGESLVTESGTAANDNIDDLLYGDDDDDDDNNQDLMGKHSIPTPTEHSANPIHNIVGTDNDKNYWCAIARESGIFQIYDLPDMTNRFHLNNFMMAPRLLKDKGSDIANVTQSGTKSEDDMSDDEDDMTQRNRSNTKKRPQHEDENRERSSDDPIVTQLVLTGLGGGKKPYLFSTLDSGYLAIYEIFPFVHSGPRTPQFKERLNIRMKKIQHSIILRQDANQSSNDFIPELSHLLDNEKEDLDGEASGNEDSDRPKSAPVAPPISIPRSKLKCFRNVAGHDGIFVCDDKPYWIMVGTRQVIRTHPMWFGAVDAFAPFNSDHCRNGFVSLASGKFQMAMLPEHFIYDSEMPVCKIPLQRTVTQILHHSEENVYALITCMKVPSAYIPVMLDTREFANEIPTDPDAALERDPRLLKSVESKYQVEMVSPVSWSTIPNTTLYMEQYEVVTASGMVKLTSEEHISGKKEYVAIGVTTVCSEDVSTKGRVLLLDVLDVVPEPGQPLTKNKFKQLCAEPQKGAVSSIAAVNGFLVIATGEKSGAKVYVYRFKNKEKLEGIAFADAMTYVNCMVSLKNLLLCGDMYQGTSLFRFTFKEFHNDQSQGDSNFEAQLTLISKDPYAHPIGSTAVSFFVHNDYLGFLSCDSLGNAILYSFTPDDPKTQGGRRLERRADFHIGSQVTSMFRIGTSPDQFETENTVKHAMYYASKQAALGIFVPVKEAVYRRLQMLQSKLNAGLQHRAGLNPKSFRMVLTQRKRRFNIKRNILDGGLLNQFLNLGIIEQREFAKRIGTPVEDILHDLAELSILTTIS